MSKQIYIDSDGNEIQVSGTVNSADMMPMSASDSTKVSEAIGSLSDLTTTVQSSIVGAVNEVVTKTKITRKKYSVTLASNPFIPPFTHFYGLDITSDATNYGSPVGVWCDNAGAIPHIQNANRVDLSANSAITCDVYVFYCSNINVIS